MLSSQEVATSSCFKITRSNEDSRLSIATDPNSILVHALLQILVQRLLKETLLTFLLNMLLKYISVKKRGQQIN